MKDSAEILTLLLLVVRYCDTQGIRNSVVTNLLLMTIDIIYCLCLLSSDLHPAMILFRPILMVAVAISYEVMD